MLQGSLTAVRLAARWSGPCMLLASIAIACSGATKSDGAPGTGGLAAEGGSAAGGGAGNLGGHSGHSGDGGTGGVLEYLGRACKEDKVCGPFDCITEDSELLNGEGPPGGMCTVSCADSPTSCTSIESGAVCVDFGGGAQFCMKACIFGPGSLSSLSDNKCYARADAACSPVPDPSGATSMVSACLPRCNSDSDCGGASHCSAKTGLCSATAATGVSLGKPCVPSTNGEPDPCRGSCEEFLDEKGQAIASLCSELCTLKVLPTCGWGGPSFGSAPAILFDCFAEWRQRSGRPGAV